MITIEQLDNVDDRLRALSLANSESLTFLPDNFYSCNDSSQFRYSVETPTCRTLLRNAGLEINELDSGSRHVYRDNHAAEWIAPTLLITSACLSQNPALVSVALNVLSSYLFRIFSHDDATVVELSIQVQSTSNAKSRRIFYKGPVEGLERASKLIERAVIED